MKTLKTIKAIIVNLTIWFIAQQFFYGLQYGNWIDFTTWTSTQLGYEFLIVLSILLSTVVEQIGVAVKPMKSPKPKDTTGPGDNIYFPNDK
jgi:hypothetical protein